jgi:hypothetical protein
MFNEKLKIRYYSSVFLQIVLGVPLIHRVVHSELFGEKLKTVLLIQLSVGKGLTSKLVQMCSKTCLLGLLCSLNAMLGM